MGQRCMMTDAFHGAKVALFIGGKLLVILRDDKPYIPFPNVWDFPGGGRENDETPFETVKREVFEEVGLTLTEDAVVWRKSYIPATVKVWFFVAEMPEGTERDIVFGDEGQRWALMTEAEFAALPNHYTPFIARLADWRGTH